VVSWFLCGLATEMKTSRTYSFLFFLLFAVRGFGRCNISKYTYDWSLATYEGALRTDSDFWRYQKQTKFLLTNGLALQLAYGKCKAYMKNLIVWKAGRYGPIDDIHTREVMCNKFCLESDRIHQEAIDSSGCSCLALSTQPNEPSYISPGDWCRHNTGRMECDELGFCGYWQCRIDDFMCPRYEYNKRYILFAGKGNCKNSGSKFSQLSLSSLSLLLSLGLVVVALLY
jgi:hypothetical protein